MGSFVGGIDDYNQNFGPNWAVLLLPYVEQSAMYAQVSTSITNYPINGDSSWRSIRGNKVKTYLCPSDVGADVFPKSQSPEDQARNRPD